MLDEEWGATIHNGVMSWTGSVQAQVEVMAWARKHVQETAHEVKVRHYMSVDYDASEMDLSIWRALTGG